MAKLYFGTKKTKIIFFSVVGFIALIIAGCIILWSWRGNPQTMIDTANQFKTDSSWVLKSESITPPKLLCIAGVEVCSDVTRSWLTKQALNHDKLQSILDKSGWNKIKITNCYQSEEKTDDVDCMAEGGIERDGGKFSITVSTLAYDTSLKGPSLSLSVRNRL